MHKNRTKNMDLSQPKSEIYIPIPEELPLPPPETKTDDEVKPSLDDNISTFFTQLANTFLYALSPLADYMYPNRHSQDTE